MTLHLTEVSSLYTLQVSDRLISGRLTDPLANKNVIYWARDAIVTVGYSGLAYDLDPTNPSVPTDEWIASKLLGGLIPRGRDNIRPTTFGAVTDFRSRDIANALQTLKGELECAFDRLTAKLVEPPFELTVAGWFFPYGRPIRPFVAELVKDRRERTVSLLFPMRNRRFQNVFGLWATPAGYLTRDEQTHLRSVLRQCPLSPPDRAELVQNEFVDIIRSVASREPEKVGAHCMTILLPPPQSNAPIRVRFRPQVEHQAMFRFTTSEFQIPVAYTPWVLGKGNFLAPSVLAGEGTSSFVMGPFTVNFEAPFNGRGFGFIGAQRRGPGR